MLYCNYLAHAVYCRFSEHVYCLSFQCLAVFLLFLGRTFSINLLFCFNWYFCAVCFTLFYGTSKWFSVAPCVLVQVIVLVLLYFFYYFASS